MPRIFISAAETSADQHGAALIEAVRGLRREVEFVGVAGPAMQAAGCRCLFDWTQHASMLFGALSQAGRAWSLLRRVAKHLSRDRYDAMVVIDSPVLHLPMARIGKRAGLPVLYYIAPQLWAWGRWRTDKLRRRVDRLAVILPFEEEFFRSRGFQADYVGHPLFDRLVNQPADEGRVAAIRSAGSPVLALLPGSRRHVVEEVLPGQLAVGAQVVRRFPHAHVRVSIAHEHLSDVVDRCLERSALKATPHRGALADLLTAADLALVASGTATLEVAYYRTPMVVMYNGSKWFYRLIGRHLIHTKHLSLVNILADREVVPEFMPYYDSTAPIGDAAVSILAADERRAVMRAQLDDLIVPLARSGASLKTAQMLLSAFEDHSAVPRGSQR